MPFELLWLLPTWLVLGVAVGILASVAVAAVFYFGDRLFPDSTGSYDQRRVDGTLRRHAEIRSYLNAIGEPFVEDQEIEGVTVAFYLPQRDVVITFDPRVFFGLESADSYVVLCEDEMPVANLGRRLPFEVEEPTTDPTPPMADQTVATAFEQLGLEAGASEDAVRDAYRSQVKEVHPDRGGTEAEFKQLQDAYTTAKDYSQQTAS